jgi:hypothetical protein
MFKSSSGSHGRLSVTAIPHRIIDPSQVEIPHSARRNGQGILQVRSRKAIILEDKINLGG